MSECIEYHKIFSYRAVLAVPAIFVFINLMDFYICFNCRQGAFRHSKHLVLSFVMIL